MDIYFQTNKVCSETEGFQGVDMNVVLAYLYMDDGTYDQERDSLTYGANCFFCLNDSSRCAPVVTFYGFQNI